MSSPSPGFGLQHRRRNKQTQKPGVQVYEPFFPFLGEYAWSTVPTFQTSSAVGIEAKTLPFSYTYAGGFEEKKKGKRLFFLMKALDQKKPTRQILLFCHPTDYFSLGDKSSADGNLGSSEDWPSSAMGRELASRDALCVLQNVSILTPKRPLSYKQWAMWSVESDCYEWQMRNYKTVLLY